MAEKMRTCKNKKEEKVKKRSTSIKNETCAFLKTLSSNNVLYGGHYELKGRRVA
jgi:hypothetical protein